MSCEKNPVFLMHAYTRHFSKIYHNALMQNDFSKHWKIYYAPPKNSEVLTQTALPSTFQSMNLSELLKRHEGKTLEFKRDLSSTANVLKTVVSFTNSSGGILLIGIEDNTRNIRGVDDPLAVQERLANIISTGISPPLMPAIEVLPWRNKTLVAAEVFPSYTRPHHLISAGEEKGTYVRVGASNRKADRPLREELARTARNEAYDEMPLPHLNSEAIDFRAASELLAPIRKITRKDLETLHLVVRHQNHPTPTCGGMILFGVNREEVFPDAWIQAGRFRGTTRTHIADTREFHDYPILAIETAMEFVQKHAHYAYQIKGLRREERWSIPLPAVREAIVNAVAHADYSQTGSPIRVQIFDNRVEIESPGLLPFGLTISDILQGVSKLRNRVIGRIFKELGLIEQWGSGISRMMDSCREHGLPPPEFEEIGTRFRVTFLLEMESTPELDDISRTILMAVQSKKSMSTKEVAEVI